MATLKKLKINLEYEDRVLVTEVPPYKTLKYIKNIAEKLFYIKNADIQMIYLHKDITQYENYLIGDFFKRKNQISIKIISLNINSKSTNNIKMKRLYILDKTNFKCICNRDLIANYCRNCKEFICNSCRINQTHINHKITQVDTDNLVESVKLYALTLQNDISVNIKKTQDNNEKYNETENNNDNNNIENRHELIKEKFDNILNVYNNCIGNLNINNDVDQVLNDYKNETKNTNGEIEKILQKIYKKYTRGKKNMTYDEFKNYFKLLSEKEDELLNKSNDILSYRVNDDLKDRMKLIYDKIEQILDYTINAKNPLGVNNETNYLYNLILKNKENNEDNETNENENNDNNNENNNNNEENEDNNNNNEKNEKNENNEENEHEDNNSKENESNEEQSENNEESENNENEEEKKKLNDIIDKNDLQKKEKNDLITKGVLNGNNNNEDHHYVDNE